jgi:hypothetical protein
LQTQDLDARKASFPGIWGDFGGTPREIDRRRRELATMCGPQRLYSQIAVRRSLAANGRFNESGTSRQTGSLPYSRPSARNLGITPLTCPLRDRGTPTTFGFCSVAYAPSSVST